jgi:hypothetical protein
MAIVLDRLDIITAINEGNSDVGAFFATVLGLPVHGDPAGRLPRGGCRRPDERAASRRTGRRAPPARRHPAAVAQRRWAGFAEAVRGRGAVIAVEPHETDRGTISADLAGPRGLLVEAYGFRPQDSPAQ